MSSTGVRNQTSLEDRAIRALIDNDKAFIQSLKPFNGGPTGGSSGQLGGTSTNSGNSPAGNFLPITGGVMNGFLALRPSDVFIADNIVDLSDVSNESSRIILTGEGFVNDSVEFFRLNAPLADTIFSIQGVIGIDLTFVNQTVTVAPDTFHRKIRTFDGSDFTLSGNQNILAFYDVVADEIVIVGTGATTGSNAFPIRPPVDARGVVAVNQAVDLSQTDGHVTTMTLAADIDVTFSGFPLAGFQQTWEVHILQDGVGNHTPNFLPAPVETVTVSQGANTLTILTFLTNDVGVSIHVVPALRGSISLSGANFANTSLSNLVATAVNQDLNMGSNDVLGATKFGFVAPGINVESTGLQMIFNNLDVAGQDFLFKFGATEIFEITRGGIFDFKGSNLNEINALGFDNTGVAITQTATDMTLGIPAGATFQANINGVAEATLSATALGLLGNNINAVGHIRMNEITAPSAVANTAHLFAKEDGDTITKLFYIQSDGTEIGPLGAGAAGANIQLSNLALTTLINTNLVSDTALTDSIGSNAIPWLAGHFGNVEFPSATGLTAGEVGLARISAPSNQMGFNVPTGFGFGIFEQGTQLALINATLADFTAIGTTGVDNLNVITSILLNDAAADPIVNGQIQRNANVLGIEIEELVAQRTTSVGTDTANLSITKVDASPGSNDDLGTLNFKVNDSGTLTTYAQVASIIRDATDAGILELNVRADNNATLQNGIRITGDDNNAMSFLTVTSRIVSDLDFGVETGATDLKISPIVNHLGISVRSGSYTIGDDGTLAVPYNAGNPPATDAGVDTDLGDFDGAAGVYGLNSSTTVSTFVWRSNGHWYGVTESRLNP